MYDVQTSLFEPSTMVVPAELPAQQRVYGLAYRTDFVTPNEELALIQQLDRGIWLNDLKRRVQHFGYKYDYKSRRIDLRMQIGKLPNWLYVLALRLHEVGLFRETPDQVIANEYEPGQGISPHIDCEPCFAETVASLSLNSSAVMEFSNDLEKTSLFIEPRSLVVLNDAARYDWRHSIPARKSDPFMGLTYRRRRRISLTFRKVIL